MGINYAGDCAWASVAVIKVIAAAACRRSKSHEVALMTARASAAPRAIRGIWLLLFADRPFSPDHLGKAIIVIRPETFIASKHSFVACRSNCRSSSSQVIECVLFLNFEAPRRLAGTPALRLSLIELALNQVTRIEKRFIRRSRCRNG
jgi:hypothetical protein